MGEHIHSIVLWLVLASCIQASRSSGQCWIYQKTGLPTTIRAVSFADSTTGYIAVGDGNASHLSGIFRTTNGGADWLPIFWGSNPRFTTITVVSNDTWMASGNDNLYGPVLIGGTGVSPRNIKAQTLTVMNHLCFPDPRHGTGVGRYGVIETTTDGGTGWVLRNSGTLQHLNGVSFVDSLLGIAVGGSSDSSLGLILRTTDGGGEWQTIYTGPPAVFYGVVYLNEYDVIVVGNHGTILRTVDGGFSWFPYQSDTTFTFTDVSFRDQRHGMVVGQGFDARGIPAGVVFSTADAGSTWDSVLIPSTTYFGVSVVDSTHATVVGAGGDMIRFTADCSSPFSISPLLPPDGTESQLLLLRDTLQYSSGVAWDFSPHRIQISTSRIQLSMDSTFAGSPLIDTLVPLNRSQLNTCLTAGHLQPGVTYYWRIALNSYDGSMTGWSAPSRFTAARGMLSGHVFADLDRDSTWETGEPGLAHWPVMISGRVQSTIYTDSLGRFALTGIDSGSFVVSGYQRPGGGVMTYPSSGLYNVTTGLNGVAADLNFGEYYPWNSIAGTVYLDKNENGVRDPGDPGLGGWPVHLEGSQSNSYTVSTDSTGAYLFPCVYSGTSTVSIFQVNPWEQEVPSLGGVYAFDIQTYGRQISGADFAVHRIPARVKLALTISDSSLVAHRDIWWGVRPGAAYGIWGVDTACTSADYSEGEFELPPPLAGMFDARFRNPRRSGEQFGNGSWTDVRAYESSAQADTYLVRFSPGFGNGGGYPVTLRWRKDLVAEAYAGAVTLEDPMGDIVDMKNAESLVVADPGISSVTLIAREPVLPTLGVREGPHDLPGQFRLRQNYPNPFNPSTAITFDLPRRSVIRLAVYDILGREVSVIANGPFGAGTHTVRWDGGTLPSGVYFYRLSVSGGERITRKMVLMR